MVGRRSLVVASAALLIPLCAATSSFAQTPKPAGKLIIVKMVDVSATAFRFEPAAVTVQPGDTVRFQQTTTTPHNASFTDAPAGSNLGEAQTGPYLITQGQTYDVLIDSRFVGGTYKVICVPHQGMGMVEVLTVRSAQGAVGTKVGGPKPPSGR